MRHKSAVTILEVLIALAVLSVLIGIAAFLIPRDGFEVNQAVQRLMRTVEGAKHEAIETNGYLLLRIDEDAQTYAWIDRDSGAVLRQVDFTEDRSNVRMSLDVASPAEILFDPRGVGHGIWAGGTLMSANEFVVALEHERTERSTGVRVNRYGRTERQ